MYHTGLVSVSFRDLTPKEIIRAAKAVGLGCIEWGSDVHAPCHDLERLTHIARLQQETGIVCSSYGTYFTLGRDDVDTLEDYIAAAKELGTNILRLWCGTKGSAAYQTAELETLYAECRQAAAVAEAHGVTLCMECHNGTLTDTKEGALALMEAVHSPFFRMYWQPNQFCSVEENVQYLQLLSTYIDHLHVFNWEGNQKFSLADGIAVWRNYLHMLEGDRTLLLEFMPDHCLSSLPVEAAAMREIIKGGS